MKQKLMVAFILIAVLFLVGWTLRASNQTAQKPQWEYRIVSFKNDSKTEGILNALGSLGWELVSTENVKGDDTLTRFYFKRPK